MILALAGLSWYVADQVLRPGFYEHRTPDRGLKPGRWTDPSVDFDLTFEDVAFPAVDGSTLRGWWVPSRSPTRVAIVTAHGGGTDRRSFMDLLPALHAAGYAVLLFDCREQGISDGAARGMGLGVREHEDVSSAVRFLREERGVETVAVLGSSQGATSAILAAARDPGIDAVVAQGTGTSLYDMMRANRRLEAFPDWMVWLFGATVLWQLGASPDAVEWGPHRVIDRIAPRPILLIQGSEDEMAPADQARRNFERAGEPREIFIVEGAGHRFLRRHAGAAYSQRVLAFLERYTPP
jgi:dipeptidyl aminopeptidase/acylaminoacyl peptidase